MDEQKRLQGDSTNFRRFTRGSCRWFTGSGWKSGQIEEVHRDRVQIRASAPDRRVFVMDARNVDQ